jgi:PAS domain S-box-containing protein
VKSKIEIFKNEELFNLLSKHANDILFRFEFQPKPKCTFISDSFERVFGYKKKEFLNNPEFYKKIIFPEDKDKYIFNLSDLKRFIKSKKANITLRHTNKKGQIIWLETVYTPIKNKKGKITSMIGISRDVSHEKITEAHLNEAREQFNIISNNAHDIIYFFSYIPKPHYLYISPSVKKVLGYEAANFYKDPFFINRKTIGANNDLKKHEKQAVAEQKNNSFKQKKVVYQMKGKDGKTIWMEDHVLPIKDEKGKIKFMFGIVRNITDKEIYAKEKLRAELAEEHNKILIREIETRNLIEAKLQTVFNTSTHIIWTVDTDYKLTSFNQNYSNQLNKYYKTNIKEGLNFKKLYKNILSKRDYDFWMDKYASAFIGNNILFETEKILDNGEKIYREIYLNPTKNKKGKVIEVVAISHNITPRKQTEQKALEQSAKLRAIFESSSHLVWTVNQKLELTYFNSNYIKTIKEKYGVDPDIGKSIYNIVPGKFRRDMKNVWQPFYNKVLNGEQVIFERKEKNAKGEEVYREVFLSPIKNENGQVFEIACLAHDITENKRYEKENIGQASKIKAIFESGTHIMWTVNKKKAYTSFNKNFSDAIFDLYGRRPEINKEMTRPENQYSSAEYHQFWNGKYEETFNGKAVEFITERTNTKGNKVYRQIYLHPIYNEKEVVEVSGMGIDISDKIASEQKIINQAAKLNAVFEGSSHYIWTIDRSGRLTSFNKNFVDLIVRSYNHEPKEGTRINSEPYVSDSEYNTWWTDQIDKSFGGQRLNFETAFTDGDKNKIYLDVYLNPIYNEQKIIEVSAIAHDITERVHHEEKVNQSLKEKEVLLKEVHHRVKNNMQVISSILNLQSSYVTDEYALSLLKESQNRIKTMAYIHESLYQNKTFTSINFSEYISTLAGNILQSYAATAQKVSLSLDVQKIILNLDTSIPAGLIINELVTNSIKHAFVGSKEGIILINLNTKDNVLFLEVSDNGKGFPKDIDFRNTNSLGLQLVNTLVEQLNGKLELSGNKNGGTSFFINFPM